MRIIHFVDSLDPDMGGPPMSVGGLASAQANLGLDVLLVANESSSKKKRIEHSIGQIPGINNVEVICCPHNDIVERIAGVKAKNIIRKLIQPEDLVHVHGIWRPMLKAACSETTSKGGKYIICPRGMLHPWALRQKPWKKKLGMLLGWRKAIKKAAYIHALNMEEAKYIRYLRLNSKVKIIPNGVFKEQFTELSSASVFLNKHPELSGKEYILFLGRLHYVKGLDYLAAAFKKVGKFDPDIELVVAGPDHGARDSFLKMINDSAVDDRVHIVGPLYGEQKIAAMHGASCFVQPSRQEGFSMAATEAMACGLPVVLSEQCNFPEVVEAGAGKIVPLDIDALAAALIYILGDERRRNSMGISARELVMSRYTWPKIAESSLQLYRDIGAVL